MARSVHLYRVEASMNSGDPRKLYYRRHSYDWDETLAAQVNAERKSYFGLAWALAKNRSQSIEVNEPLYLKALILTTFTVAVSRLADLPRRYGAGPTQICFYAIENSNPFVTITSKLARQKLPVRFVARPGVALFHVAFKYVVRNSQRIAFGTPGARRMYEQLGVDTVGTQTCSVREFLELPSVCTCGALEKIPQTLLFVGEFSERKGLPELLDAWTHIEKLDLYPRFVLIGKGPLEGLARTWSAARPSRATVLVDPPRDVIHANYREATISFLLSQPDPAWREQVGLPIKEALGHGCLVVTTSETGLATWLERHGHVLVPPGPLAPAAVMKIADEVRRRRVRHESIGELPSTDARDAADRWLHQ